MNVGLFWVAFRVLTAREVTRRQLRGGAFAAGVLYESLQTLGGYLSAQLSLMIEQPPTTADKRALTQRGKIEERRRDETASIDFPAPEPTDAPDPDAASDDGGHPPSG